MFVCFAIVQNRDKEGNGFILFGHACVFVLYERERERQDDVWGFDKH